MEGGGGGGGEGREGNGMGEMNLLGKMYKMAIAR